MLGSVAVAAVLAFVAFWVILFAMRRVIVETPAPDFDRVDPLQSIVDRARELQAMEAQRVQFGPIDVESRLPGNTTVLPVPNAGTIAGDAIDFKKYAAAKSNGVHANGHAADPEPIVYRLSAPAAPVEPPVAVPTATLTDEIIPAPPRVAPVAVPESEPNDMPATAAANGQAVSDAQPAPQNGASKRRPKYEVVTFERAPSAAQPIFDSVLEAVFEPARIEHSRVDAFAARPAEAPARPTPRPLDVPPAFAGSAPSPVDAGTARDAEPAAAAPQSRPEPHAVVAQAAEVLPDAQAAHDTLEAPEAETLSPQVAELPPDPRDAELASNAPVAELAPESQATPLAPQLDAEHLAPEFEATHAAPDAAPKAEPAPAPPRPHRYGPLARPIKLETNGRPQL